MLIFNKNYLTLAILLFIVEILIALYAHDEIIRPYGGDFLVVILLYCLLKSIIRIKDVFAALFVLIFSFFVELTQYFHLIKLIGLENNNFAKTILGTFFTWADILAYTLGTLFTIMTEHIINTMKIRYLHRQKNGL